MEKAQADIQSEMDAMRKGAGIQDELLTPENVSIDGNNAGNDVSSLAPGYESGIMNEGAQGEAVNGAVDARPDAQAAVKTKKFSEMSYDDALVIAKDYAKKAPITIPETATMKPKTMNNGYEQITYLWRDGVYKYEVRWHSRTPGAPQGQGNTWVIRREIPGIGGQKPRSYVKIGNSGTDADWIPRYEWFDAIDARQLGTATPEQVKILDMGHWGEEQ